MPSANDVIAAVVRWRRLARFSGPTGLEFDDEALDDLLRGAADDATEPHDAAAVSIPAPPAELATDLASLLTAEPQQYGELESLLAPLELHTLRAAADDVDGRQRVSLALSLAYWFESAGRREEARAEWDRLEAVVRIECDSDYALWEFMYAEVPRHAVAYWESGGAAREAARWSWLADVLTGLDQVLAGAGGAPVEVPATGRQGLLADALDGLFEFARQMHAEGHDKQVQELRHQVVAVGVTEGLAGAGHPCTAISLRALAMPISRPYWPDQPGTYHQQGNVASLPLCRDELRILEAVLGPTHTILADSLNCIGACLCQLGQLAPAEEHLSRAIAMGCPVPHPYRWLALVYQQRAAPGDDERELAAWQRYLEAGPPAFREEEARARATALSLRLPNRPNGQEWNRLR